MAPDFARLDNMKRQEYDSVAVIIPVYNNAETLPRLLDELTAVLEGRGGRYEVVVVDDGSADRSWSCISEAARRDPNIKGIRFSRNFGQHAAISAALQAADSSCLVLMDADLQDAPADIPALLDALHGDIEIVYSIPKDVDSTHTARRTSGWFWRAFDRLAGTSTPTGIRTFRAFTRRVADAMVQYDEFNVVYGPLMYSAGFQSTVVELVHHSRPVGRSSYSFKKRITLAFKTMITYSALPFYAFITLGLLSVVGSLGYLIVVLVQRVLNGPTLTSGLELMVALELALIGILMSALGVLGAYVFETFVETLRRPRFLVAATTAPVNERTNVTDIRVSEGCRCASSS